MGPLMATSAHSWTTVVACQGMNADDGKWWWSRVEAGVTSLSDLDFLVSIQGLLPEILLWCTTSSYEHIY